MEARRGARRIIGLDGRGHACLDARLGDRRQRRDPRRPPEWSLRHRKGYPGRGRRARGLLLSRARAREEVRVPLCHAFIRSERLVGLGRRQVGPGGR